MSVLLPSKPWEISVSIFIFAEGTLFSKEKKELQNSPFKHLLLPKPGGVGLTLSTMPYINKLIDFSDFSP